jgi:hypothetical protein
LSRPTRHSRLSYRAGLLPQLLQWCACAVAAAGLVGVGRDVGVPPRGGVLERRSDDRVGDVGGSQLADDELGALLRTVEVVAVYAQAAGP